jgi:hypothetical protein
MYEFSAKRKTFKMFLKVKQRNNENPNGKVFWRERMGNLVRSTIRKIVFCQQNMVEKEEEEENILNDSDS